MRGQNLLARVRVALGNFRCDGHQTLILQAAHGAICAVPAADGTLVVAIADAEVNIGLLRLALLKVAEVMG